jgi:hypothetical protein
VNGALLFIGGVLMAEGLVRVPTVSGIETVGETNAARSKLELMIQQATTDIVLTSGRLNPKAYYPLKELIEEKLKSGVSLQIVCGEYIPDFSPTPDSDPKLLWRNVLQGWIDKYPNRFQLYRFAGDPAPHGMLVDGRSLRIEKEHTPSAADRSNLYISRATIAAAHFLSTFEDYKSHSTRVYKISDVATPP